MADERTCEVGATLAPFKIWPLTTRQSTKQDVKNTSLVLFDNKDV
jgi:hypothetical protein